MARYQVKREDVEAEQYTGKNWNLITSWLGKHLTKSEKPGKDKDETRYVFDIETKLWQPLEAGQYIVRDSEGAISLYSKKVFEDKWEPVKNARDWNPLPLPKGPGDYPPFGPYRATFGDGGSVRP